MLPRFPLFVNSRVTVRVSSSSSEYLTCWSWRGASRCRVFCVKIPFKSTQQPIQPILKSRLQVANLPSHYTPRGVPMPLGVKLFLISRQCIWNFQFFAFYACAHACPHQLLKHLRFGYFD